MIMNTTIRKFTYFLTACLLGCLTAHAYEQDNWYLAWEVPVSSSYGVAYWENNNTGVGQIYVGNGVSTGARISVYDLNGSLVRHINIGNARYFAYDLDLDQEGNIYIGEKHAVTCLSNGGNFIWRMGKSTSISNYGSGGSANGEFNYAEGIAVKDNNLLYVADRKNHRIQVLDKNGIGNIILVTTKR